MTRNQRLVLVWFEEHCSTRGFIRISASEIAAIFGWSEQYTKKILRGLLEDGSLVKLQPGAGHRPTRYLVSSRGNQNGPRGNKIDVAQQVHSYNQKREHYFSTKTLNPKEEEYAHPTMHVYKGSVFDNVISPLKVVKAGNSPFKRFRTRCDDVDLWNLQDFVCYYSFVYRVKFGEMPTINWRNECSAAKLLLKRLNEKWIFKVFIQTAFLIITFKPKGLHSLLYNYFFADVISRKPTEDELDEYDDVYVFPWLYQEYKKTSTLAQDEYDKHLLKTYLGL